MELAVCIAYYCHLLLQCRRLNLQRSIQQTSAKLSQTCSAVAGQRLQENSRRLPLSVWAPSPGLVPLPLQWIAALGE
jgi:hypothetical protein